MNFGYLIIVSENKSHDYYRLAYALALSIKNTQKEGYDKVAIVLDDKKKIQNFNSTWVFDEIIEWNEETYWYGRSHMDELTPWEYTVCLDADMLFMTDYSHWIDYFVKNTDLYIANHALTYRGEKVGPNNPYRKCFIANDLPNLYSFYTFFVKDSPRAKEFFNLARAIIKSPNEFSNNFLTKYKPKEIGTDESFALASKILDNQNEIAFPLEFPKVVHLKGGVQNFPWQADKASDHIGFYFDVKGKLKLGNYQQHNIVHYVEKDKISLEVVNILEEIAWKK